MILLDKIDVKKRQQCQIDRTINEVLDIGRLSKSKHYLEASFIKTVDVKLEN